MQFTGREQEKKRNGNSLPAYHQACGVRCTSAKYGLATRTRPTFSGNQADEVALNRIPIRRNSTRERKPQGRSRERPPEHTNSHTRGSHPVSSTSHTGASCGDRDELA